MISLLLLNNFYFSEYHTDEFKRKRKRRIIIHTVHSLWSANQLPAQGVEEAIILSPKGEYFEDSAVARVTRT